MTKFRILVLGVPLALALSLSSPVLADTPGAKPSPTAHPETTSADDEWNGTGGIYRIMAMSAGVLAGAGAMSLFIDGWVVDLFAQTGNLTTTEAIEIVQDMESQGGFEMAAILLSGVAGGLIADNLYLKGAAILPGALDRADEALRPSVTAATDAWTWLQNKVGDGGDWLQNRSREIWDRGQAWGEKLRDKVIGGR